MIKLACRDRVPLLGPEIVADAVQFGPKAGGSSAPQSEGYTPAQSSAPAAAAVPDLDTIDYGDANINVDDIPF